ncbi:hypothetical protein N657DRAFT_648552 [Parathielavia appendiculata]|uniref:Uncharacterized protein n=1 Tax=Parathielavia appendiculata TaxID=2587402 RepID=A0AAN6TU81_9PEZI|nr:hypothetical protein N657DRAFT_648552 [Parathielavia appendiculata]
MLGRFQAIKGNQRGNYPEMSIGQRSSTATTSIAVLLHAVPLLHASRLCAVFASWGLTSGTSTASATVAESKAARCRYNGGAQSGRSSLTHSKARGACRRARAAETRALACAASSMPCSPVGLVEREGFDLTVVLLRSGTLPTCQSGPYMPESQPTNNATCKNPAGAQTGSFTVKRIIDRLVWLDLCKSKKHTVQQAPKREAASLALVVWTSDFYPRLKFSTMQHSLCTITPRARLLAIIQTRTCNTTWV